MAEVPRKPGPDPERLKIDESWEDAVKKALQKKRPADGWPDDESDDAPTDPDEKTD